MPLNVTPKRLTFGTLMRRGPDVTKKVSIHRGDAGPIAPKVHPPRLSNLSAKVCEIEPGERYELEITVEEPRRPGPFSDVIKVETGIDEVSEMHVVVSGEIAPRVAITPSELQFPPRRERPVDRTVHLHWDDGVPVAIRTTTTTLPEATVAVNERRGAQVIVVTMPAGIEPPSGDHTLTFTTDDVDVPSRTVPIRFGDRTRARRAAKAGQTNDAAANSRRVTPLKPRSKPAAKQQTN